MASKNSRVVTQLNNILDSQIDKYSYYLARYLNDASIDLRSQYEYNYMTQYAFDFKQDSDLVKSAYTNVIKSVIDTLTSKIAAQKVRPFFNPVNGTYKTRQTVKDIQTYFDKIYDDCNIHTLMSEAFRDACIFGKGYVYINPVTYKIGVVKPHCISFLDSDCKYDTPKRMLLRYLNFPVARLKDYKLESQRQDTVTLWHYIDAEEHTQEFFINGKSVKTLKYDSDYLPVIELFYNKPVFGNQSLSIVHELDGIQSNIDMINAKISACSQLNPGNVTYVIEGSNLSVADVDNRVGKVYGIRMPPGTNTPPVVNVAPPLFDPQWLNLLQYYVKTAYEVTGVSQLSAQAKKPTGADSGIALQTIEDVESDRLEIAMNHYIQSYSDLAKLIIEVMPDNDKVLPESFNSSSMKWSEVKKQRDLFKIQFSQATALSKDPAEKLKQLMQWTQIGLISQDQIAKFADLPDLEDATNLASAANDGVEQCIQRAIEYEEYDIPEFVNYQSLAQAIAKEENILYASLTDDEDNNEEVEESVARLMILEQNLLQTMQDNGFADLGNDVEEQQMTDNGEMASGQGSTQVADITQTLDNGDAQGLQNDNVLNNDEANAQENLTNPNAV